MSEKLPMTGGSGRPPEDPSVARDRVPDADPPLDEGPGEHRSDTVATEAPDPGAGAPIPQRPRASSARLVATLAVAGAVAGFFIVLVHQWSQPRIEAYQARVLQDAVQEVLGAPDRTETWFLHDGTFTPAPPAGADTADLDRVYLGFASDGSAVGVAAAAAEPGFQDVIRLIFGYDPGESKVLGMKVLESKETPGLGDKIEKDSVFVAEFSGAVTPLLGVKPSKATGSENEIDMITGATISSEAVIDIINNRLAALEGPLGQLWRQGPVTAAGAGAGAAEAADPPVATTAPAGRATPGAGSAETGVAGAAPGGHP